MLGSSDASRQEGVGFEFQVDSSSFSMGSLWVFSGIYDLLPQFKDMHVRINLDTKMSVTEFNIIL